VERHYSQTQVTFRCFTRPIRFALLLLLLLLLDAEGLGADADGRLVVLLAAVVLQWCCSDMWGA